MKKLKEIEFNAELIGKEGIVIKYRSGEMPLQIVWMDKSTLNRPILTIPSTDNGNGMLDHHLSGKFYLNIGDTEYDLIMYQEVEVKEPRVIWVNIYENDIRLYPHLNEEDAREAFSASGKTIKFIEVIEEGE